MGLVVHRAQKSSDMQYASLDVLVNTQHTQGTITAWLLVSHSESTLSVLSAEYLELDMIIIPLCNGKYDHLEKEGLALSCGFGKKLNISSFLCNGIFGVIK